MTYEERLQNLTRTLKLRWIRLLTGGNLGFKASESFAHFSFEMLEKLYGAHWRRYHVLFHLDRMLTEFDKVRAKLKHPELVEFAIFLHDIIYVIGRKDNELKSAHVAKHWLMLMGADALTTCRVVRLITVATKHPKSPKARLTSDEKYMSDFDLYGFSLSWDAVLGQTRDVRREFSKFSDDDFRKGNGDFIMSMMRKPVYLTEHYKQYEAFAKENMRMILQNMDQVVIARPTDKRL